MAQFKRFSGSESESYNSGYVGREGELTWDPDNGLRIHDGNESGGNPIGITSYQSLNDLPTNLASIQPGSGTNNRQFLRYNSSTYEMEYANDFRIVPFADIDYPNGVVGDKVGDVAFDDSGIYYCGGEPNFIGTATLGDASGYVPGAWITLTSIPASGPVQVGQRLTDGTITSTVEEIVEGWPGYTGQRMIVRMTSDVSWHSGATGTVLDVISSGESVSTGNWVKFSKSYNDLSGTPDSILDFNIADGSNGQVLTTNGAGAFSFAAPSVDANDLTGTTLASGVVDSSLTSVGTLTDLTVSGTTTLNGTESNVVRRAFGLVAADTFVTLDDLKVKVTSSTSQLGLALTTGSWQATGWTETFQGGGTPSVNNWINLPLSTGYDNASGAMPNQGNGCRCVISDQTPNAKMYQITAMRAGTSGAMWNISIERLV